MPAAMPPIPADLRRRIVNADIRTARVIPRGATKAFGALLAAAASDLVRAGSSQIPAEQPDARPLQAVLRLALALPGTRRDLTASSLRGRCALLRQGRYDVVAHDVLPLFPRPRPRQRGNAARTARVLASLGYPGKATRVLASAREKTGAPPVPTRGEVDGHFPPCVDRAIVLPEGADGVARGPTRRGYIPVSRFCRRGTRSEWIERVWGAIGQTSRTASPGPSGLNRPILEAAMRACPEAVTAVAALTDAMCGGWIHDNIVSDFTLVAVPKGAGGGWRPIGMGEVLRTSAMRIVAADVNDAVRDHLAPEQLLLEQGGASQLHVKVSRAVGDGKYVLACDITRAFSHIDIQHVVECAAAVLPPELMAPVRSMYASAPTMRPTWRGGDADAPVRAERGVVQGDPLGAVLFAIAFKPVYQAAAADTGVEVQAYADDLYAIDVDQAPLVRFHQRLAERCAAVGLSLAEGKTKWLGMRSEPPGLDGDPLRGGPDDHHYPVSFDGGPQPEVHDQYFEDAVNEEVEDEFGDAEPLDRVCARARTHVVGGAPIRCPDVSERELRRRVRAQCDELVRPVAAIADFLDPQHALAALRQAGSWCRLLHLLSTMRAAGTITDEVIVEECAHAERTDLEAFLAGVLGPHAGAIAPHHWAQATLPVREGGLGIVACTAYGTDIVNAHAAVITARVDGGDVTSARDELRTRSETHIADAKRRLTRLLNVQDRIRFNDVSRGSGPAWLHAVASDWHQTRMSPAAASTAVALHLGVPMFDGTDVCACGSVIDPRGDHVRRCKSFMTTRHNAVRDRLGQLLRPAAEDGSTVQVEQAVGENGAPRGAARGERRPGDVTLRVAGQRTASYIDVVIAGPHEDDNDRVNIPARAVDVKLDSANGGRVASAGAEYAPMAMSWWGSVAGRSAAFLGKVGSALTQAGRELLHSDGIDCAPAFTMRQRLSMWAVQLNAERVADARMSANAPGRTVVAPSLPTDPASGRQCDDRALLAMAGAVHGAQDPPASPPDAEQQRRRGRRRRRQAQRWRRDEHVRHVRPPPPPRPPPDDGGGPDIRSGGVGTIVAMIAALAQRTAADDAAVLDVTSASATTVRPNAAMKRRADFCSTLQWVVAAAHASTATTEVVYTCGLFNNNLAPHVHTTLAAAGVDTHDEGRRVCPQRLGDSAVSPPHRL